VDIEVHIPVPRQEITWILPIHKGPDFDSDISSQFSVPSPLHFGHLTLMSVAINLYLTSKREIVLGYLDLIEGT
jgi:hypothetical protein